MEKDSVAQKNLVDGSIFEPVLHKLYYTPEEGSAFGGIKALYRAAKKQFPNITLRIVDDFLHRQKTYVDHKNLTRKFDRRMYTSDRPFSIFGIDLVFLIPLKPYNHGYSIILTAVDFFSRYLYARALKTKTQIHVKEALLSIFGQAGQTPEKIHR